MLKQKPKYKKNTGTPQVKKRIILFDKGKWQEKKIPTGNVTFFNKLAHLRSSVEMSLGKCLLIAESLPATDSFQEAYSLQTRLKDVFIFGKKKKWVEIVGAQTPVG